MHSTALAHSFGGQCDASRHSTHLPGSVQCGLNSSQSASLRHSTHSGSRSDPSQ